MNRKKLYVNLNILFPFRNRIRSGLIILGSVLGLMLFFLGNGFIEGYFRQMYKKAYAFCDNALVLSNIEDGVRNAIEEALEYSRKDEVLVVDQKNILDENIGYNGKGLQRSLQLIGINGLVEENKPVICNDNGDYCLTTSTLLYGRHITEEDVRNKNSVVVIEKYVSEVLFGRENAVGQKIEFSNYYGKVELEVIGIIDNLSINEDKILDIKKSLEKSDVEEINAKCIGYVPYSFVETMFINDEAQLYTVYFYDEENREKAETIIASVLNDTGIIGGFDSRYSRLIACDEEKAVIQGVFNTLIFIVVFFSGMILLTVFIFGVKERIYEIGIRRAIGASKYDVFAQFVLEGLVMSLISATITASFGIIIINYVNGIMMKVLYSSFRIIISSRVVFATFGIAILQGMLFSVVPAMIAANTDPTKAIKWE